MRSIETYETLAARAAHYGLIDVQVRALLDLSFPWSWTSSERCLDALERARRLAVGQNRQMHTRTRASCAFRRLWADRWNSQDAQEHSAAVAEIRKTNDRPALAAHLIEDSFIRCLSSEYREAHRVALESRAQLLEGSEENLYLNLAYGRSQTIVPFSLLFLGEWGEALREFAAGIALEEKNGNYYLPLWLRSVRAWVYLHALDFRGVLEICDSLLPLLRQPVPCTEAGSRMSLPAALQIALICSGWAAAASGDSERALEDLSAASREMDCQPVRFDWYWRMPLAAAFTELWLAKGDRTRARLDAERFLDATLASAERTWQGLAWEVNARVAMVELDTTRARECIAKALSTMQGFEVPLAAWRVHATAAELEEALGNLQTADSHRELSRATIQQLADSLPAEEPLRRIFLAAPAVAKILNRQS
jgi:tetratricopeptide (TPR) repeat protein